MATFRQRNGRWQAIIRRVDLHDARTFDRKVDAQSWARAREREADLGHLPGKVDGTLSAVIDRYEKEMWPDKRWGRNKSMELDILRRDLGARTLDTFTQAQLLAYVRGLEKAGPSTRLTRLSYLKEVLRTAKELWGLPMPLPAVEGAIATGRRLGVLARPKTRERRPTADEIAAILDYCKDREGSIDLGVVVRILSIMPLRLSELLRIGWGDEVKERRSAILRTRKHPDIREKERPQEVPLITFDGVDTYEMVFGRHRYMDAPFPYKANSVSTIFLSVVKTLQIRDLHLHDMRAYAISRLLEAGMPIPQVALLSGHRNWKILSKHYARIDPQSVHDTLKRLT